MSFFKRLGDGFVRLFASYGLCVVVLVLLTVLTFLGTLEQEDRGIYDVQEQYFNSFFLVSDVLGFPILMPGAYLLLAILFVNLIVGGMVRMRKKTSTIGILITHIGMAILLLGGLIEFYFSKEGYMDLPVVGEARGEFRSYGDWELVIREPLSKTRVRDHIIPADQIQGLEGDDARVFQHKNLPFQLRASNYLRNATRIQERRPGVGYRGFEYVPAKLQLETGQNMPALTVNIIGEDASPQRILLHGKQDKMEVVRAGGKAFGVQMRRETYELPFEIELKEFVFDKHPGTTMASEYSSYVDHIEGGTREKVHITMNQPMRHKGFILYQASYQQVELPSGEKHYFPVLTVSQNPADRIPLIAVVIISLGLLIHFSIKLYRYISAESRRRTA